MVFLSRLTATMQRSVMVAQIMENCCRGWVMHPDNSQPLSSGANVHRCLSNGYFTSGAVNSTNKCHDIYVFLPNIVIKCDVKVWLILWCEHNETKMMVNLITPLSLWHFGEVWTNAAHVVSKSLIQTRAGRRLQGPGWERKAASNDPRVIRKLLQQLLSQLFHLCNQKDRTKCSLCWMKLKKIIRQKGREILTTPGARKAVTLLYGDKSV